jgi:iron-sulfur cluster insertion protein
MTACATQSDASTHGAVPRSAAFVPPTGAEPIRMTDAVIAKVAEMLAEENYPSLRLRIFITGGGCSGFQYGFAFDDAAKDDDLAVTQGPVTVLVDAMSMQYLVGAEIDYEDKLEGARFVIRNPNAQTTCGCGSSFSV